MEKQKGHQLQIIWNDMPSPISIPEETKIELANLLGDLLSAYWEKRKVNKKTRPKEDKHDI